MIFYIPLAEWKRALYEVLKAHVIGYEIHGNIDPIFPDDTIPEKWVEVGSCTCTPSSAKISTISYRMSTVVHAYCKGQSEQMLNEMLNDVGQSASAGVDLNEYALANFICQSVNFDLAETNDIEFEGGEAGQHGLIRIVAELQQKEI